MFISVEGRIGSRYSLALWRIQRMSTVTAAGPQNNSGPIETPWEARIQLSIRSRLLDTI